MNIFLSIFGYLSQNINPLVAQIMNFYIWFQKFGTLNKKVLKINTHEYTIGINKFHNLEC